MKLKIIKVDNYADAEKKCSKGYRMLYDWELLKEARTNKKSPLRYNGEYRWFYAKRTVEDIEKGNFVRLSSGIFDHMSVVVGYGFGGGDGFAFGVFKKKGAAHG